MSVPSDRVELVPSDQVRTPEETRRRDAVARSLVGGFLGQLTANARQRVAQRQREALEAQAEP